MLFARVLLISHIAFGLLNTTRLAAQQTPPAPPPSPRVTLLQAERELAVAIYRQGYARALSSALAEDAVFLYEGAPVIVGREHARTLLDAQPVLARLRLVAQPITVVVSADGNHGATWGTLIVSERAHPADSMPRPASYITMWRRPAGGAWQAVARVDAGLVDPATVVLPPAIAALPPVRVNLMARPVLDFARADATFARVAGERGAPVAFEEFAAPDGATFGAGGTLNLGPSAIRAALQAARSGGAFWSWSPVYGAGAPAGDFGFTVGESTIRLPGTSAADAYQGKYLTVWRRQADGTVKYLIDAGNGRPGPASR